MSPADVAAHEAASYVRPPRKILAEFPVGHPRGQFPAEEKARQLTEAGTPATVRQDIGRDRFLVVAVTS
ncbi:hypothetical protein C1N81_39550 [Streptomyces sp. SGAir0957]